MSEHKKSVLIVDDDPDSLETLRMLLIEEGYAVRAASSGAEAILIIREAVPDIMVLDVMMPGMSGYDLCRYLRDRPTTRDTPIIAYTGHQAVAHSNAGLYDRVLIKPAEISELRQAIESLIAR